MTTLEKLPDGAVMVEQVCPAAEAPAEGGGVVVRRRPDGTVSVLLCVEPTDADYGRWAALCAAAPRGGPLTLSGAEDGPEAGGGAPDATGDEYGALADFYAGLLDALAKAGADTDEVEEIAGDELEGSGWALRHGDAGWSAVPEGEAEEDDGEDAVEMAGGEGWDRHRTRTGRMVWRKKVGKKWRYHYGLTAPGTARSAAVERAKQGHPDHAATREKLARLAGVAGGDVTPHPSDRAAAGRALAGMARHHGGRVGARVADLADAVERALGELDANAIPPARREAALIALRRQAAMLHHMLGMAKEPWQHTAKEWADKHPSKLQKARDTVLRLRGEWLAAKGTDGEAEALHRFKAAESAARAGILGGRAEGAVGAEEGVSREHEAEVRKAVAAGKPVPEGVLRDYPDLQPKAAAKKEPWQMTRQEWANADGGKFAAARRNAHATEVFGAARQGLPIPPEVRKQYKEDLDRIEQSMAAQRAAEQADAKSKEEKEASEAGAAAAPETVPLSEYLNNRKVVAGLHGRWYRGHTNRSWEDFPAFISREGGQEHRLAVMAALAKGKPVPPEVLADYPDLAPKPAVAEAPAQAPAPAGEAPPEPGFTGTDRLGREWRDGKLVAKQEEVKPDGRAATAPDDGADGRRRALVGGVDGGGDGRAAGEVRAPAGRIVTARAAHTRPGDPALVPESLRGKLDAHQQDGVAKAIGALDTHGGFLLADGTGVGKTRQQLAVAKAYADRGKKVLIVTRAEVIKPDWKKGAVSGSFAADSDALGVGLKLNGGADPLAPGAVHVTTYDRIADIKGMVDKDTVIIFDESHSLKNWDSARSKHGYEMGKKAGAVMYATATPADKPLHIAHLFRAKVFGDRPWEETYRELGMKQVEIRTPTGQTVKKWEIDPRVGAAEVYRRMAGLFDRMTAEGLMLKREISFEGVDVGFERVALPPEAHEAMARIEEAMRFSGAGPGLRRAMTLMHQRRQQETYKIPHTVEVVKKELAEGRQVVVFASRVNESEVPGGAGEEAAASSAGTAGALREALHAAGVAPEDVVELHGGVTPKKRLKATEDFQSGRGKVIIATVESGGTGINLDDVAGDRPRTLVMMTAPFSAVENVQAAGRVWRLKTKSLPRVRYLFGDTEVDRWNAGLIGSKMKTLGAAVSGEVMALDVPDLGLSPEGEAEAAEDLKVAAKAAPYEWPALTRPRPTPAAPVAAAGAAAPAAAPAKAATSVKHRRVKTARGERLVHTFEPGEDFWRVWKSAGRPGYLSASKNPRTGRWEASVWAADEAELEANVGDLDRRGVRRRTLDLSALPDDDAPASPHDGKALADLYASLFSAIEEAGGAVTPAMLDEADDEIFGSGWVLKRDPSGGYYPLEADDDDGDEDAPGDDDDEGGVEMAGAEGGPTPVKYTKRDGSQGWKVQAAGGKWRYLKGDPTAAKAPSGKAAPAPAGPKAPADAQALRSLLEKHRGEGELTAAERATAKRSLAALKRAHGDKVLDRVGDLAEKLDKAAAKATPDKAAKLKAEARKLHALVDLLGPMDGGAAASAEPEPKKPEPKKSPPAKGKAPPKAPPVDEAAAKEKVLGMLREGGDGTTLLRDVRRALPPMSQEDFSRLMIGLAEEGKVALHRHDHPFFLTDAERAELARDPETGTYFTSAGIRYDQTSSPPPPRSAGRPAPAAAKQIVSDKAAADRLDSMRFGGDVDEIIWRQAESLLSSPEDQAAGYPILRAAWERMPQADRDAVRKHWERTNKGEGHPLNDIVGAKARAAAPEPEPAAKKDHPVHADPDAWAAAMRSKITPESGVKGYDLDEVVEAAKSGDRETAQYLAGRLEKVLGKPRLPAKKAPPAKAPAPAPAKGGDHVADLVAAAKKAGGRDNLASMADLREALPHLSRPQFDAAVQEARRRGLLSAAAVEGRHATTDPATTRRHLDAGIDEDGQRLGFLSVKDGGEAPPAPAAPKPAPPAGAAPDVAAALRQVFGRDLSPEEIDAARKALAPAPAPAQVSAPGPVPAPAAPATPPAEPAPAPASGRSFAYSPDAPKGKAAKAKEEEAVAAARAAPPARQRALRNAIRYTLDEGRLYAGQEDGLIEIPFVVHKVRERLPDATPEEVHAELLRASADRDIALHVLNEVKSLRPQDRDLGIWSDDRMMYYADLRSKKYGGAEDKAGA